MKIKRIKFYQSIKCNSIEKSTKNEYNYLEASSNDGKNGDPYNINIEDQFVKIEHIRTKEITYTGMNNVVYFNPE